MTPNTHTSTTTATRPGWIIGNATNTVRVHGVKPYEPSGLPYPDANDVFLPVDRWLVTFTLNTPDHSWVRGYLDFTPYDTGLGLTVHEQFVFGLEPDVVAWNLIYDACSYAALKFPRSPIPGSSLVNGKYILWGEHELNNA